ncbi:unnamed protein product [Cylindrotheca closterium]|uniref:Uncharacterized protein n=1 Tax=Cylindrotheca closterium TaxID=2856 RepID=A0AAD2FWW3_9STRA|nr:unnamed protein product [Cylindrotheca closterium]
MPPTMEDEYTVILQDRHDNEASEDEGDESEDDSVVATENPPHVVSPAPKGANSPKKRPRSPEDDNPTIFVAEPPKKKVNRKYSIAHEFITNGNFYVIHIDVEHGGEGCGIVQLSAVIYDPAQWK